MSTTSQKHRDFVGEPMGDKPVMALSGIGETLGKKLEDQGFDKVYGCCSERSPNQIYFCLFAHFLSNEVRFPILWLQDVFL